MTGPASTLSTTRVPLFTVVASMAELLFHTHAPLALTSSVLKPVKRLSTVPLPCRMSLLVAPAAVLPSASPISTDPVCRISVLVPVPLNFTEFVPPLIVPAFFTVPEPKTSMPPMPPLIVAPVAFVTSAVKARMPCPPPEIVPPLTLFTVAWVPPDGVVFAPVASILPALAVTLMVPGENAAKASWILPPMRLSRITVVSTKWRCHLSDLCLDLAGIGDVRGACRDDGNTVVRPVASIRPVLAVTLMSPARNDGRRSGRDDPRRDAIAGIVDGGGAVEGLDGVAAEPFCAMRPKLFTVTSFRALIVVVELTFDWISPVFVTLTALPKMALLSAVMMPVVMPSPVLFTVAVPLMAMAAP